jgi:succinoglycan biosynthesis transport protein ExoP
MSQRSQLPVVEPDVDFAPLGFHKASQGRSIDIARFAISRWKMLALGLMGGAFLGVLFYLWSGPVYRASTRVQVSKKASLPINSQEARRYTDRSQHIHFLMSDTIAAIAIEKYGLKDVPAIANAKDPLKAVWEDTSAKIVAGQDTSFDSIIELAYESSDKVVAKTVVEAIVKAYEDWLGQTRDKNSAALFATLQQSKMELTQEISSLERDWRSWREASPYFYPTPPIVAIGGIAAPPSNPNVQALQSVIKDQESLQAQRANIQGKIATLKKMIESGESRDEIQFWVMHALSTGTGGGGGEAGAGGGGAGATILAGPTGKAELDHELLITQLVEKRLLQALGENHADVKNVRGQLQTILQAYRTQGIVPPDLDSKVAETGPAAAGKRAGVDLPSVYLYILESQLEELKIREGLLATRRVDAEKKAKEASLFDADDQNKKDQVSFKKKELEGLNNQISDYMQSRSQEGFQMSQISQVRLERSLKQIIKIFGAFCILGLASVFCLSYFREWRDTTLRSVEEVRDVTGTAVVGSVPHFDNPQLGHSTADTGIAPQVVYLHRPGSREAEAYRSIRTTLFFTTRDIDTKVIQVSSSEPGDGKSTTTANLAVAMAQSGKRVILIDADLRRPTVHTLFGLQQGMGLADTLNGDLTLATIIKETPVANLSIITAGLSPDNPAELLSTAGLEEILKSLRKRYDYILIDSPPVLAVSDPCIIAPHADAMLLVVRLQKNKRAVLQRTRELLGAHGIRLLGIIANDMGGDPNSDAYDRYDEYYVSETKRLEPRREPVGV